MSIQQKYDLDPIILPISPNADFPQKNSYYFEMIVLFAHFKMAY